MFAKYQHTGLTAVACDAVAGDRTLELTDKMDEASSVGFSFQFTAGAAGDTIVTVVLSKSADQGTTWAQVPAWTYAGSGAYTGDDYSQVITLTAADSFWVEVDMRNANGLKIVFSTNTTDAADTMTVQACSDLNR